MKKFTLLVMATLLMASCGAVAEKAAERVVENAIEKAAEEGDGSGGDVDVDVDDGGITFSGSDGESVQIGEGVEIPADFPIPILDGGTAIYSLNDPAGGTASLTMEYPHDAWDVLIEMYNDYFSGSEVQKIEAPDLMSWTDTSSGHAVMVIGGEANGVVVSLTAASTS